MEHAAPTPRPKRPASQRTHTYSLGEEIANSVSHGAGVAMSLAGLIILVAFAGGSGDPAKIASAIVYGVALVLEYTASTLYHALPQPSAKHVFKVLDHAGIYVLIAGTYTPFTLVTLRGPVGWWLFGAVWTLAAAGVAVEAFWTYRPRWVSSLIYVVLGWIVVVAMRPLLAELAPGGFWLLLAGGLTYTLGAAVYLLKRIRYLHAVWHGLVLVGSILHFLAILLYVILPA